MRKSILSSLVFLLSIALSAQNTGTVPTASPTEPSYNYQFRLQLTDKGKTPFSINKPEDFLSQKAIDRRNRYNISIDESDLPISSKYIEAVQSKGVTVIASSKWMQTITIHCTDSLMIDEVKKLPFVKDATFVWKGMPTRPVRIDENKDRKYTFESEYIIGDYYGAAFDNININNGQALHDAGFKGQGMDIAVIDAGFSYLPNLEAMQNMNIKGVKNFVYGRDDVFAEQNNKHGLMVLSCMATNKPNQFVGTAPLANYWLLRSEDTRSEFPVEEDYWVAAAEYADSCGVDVVNTSLGYTKFDFPSQSPTINDLDGKTAFISIGANMLAEKGVLFVCSAGNSGRDKWRKISSPGDALGALTIGAVSKDSTVADFSSRGFSADMRIKPDAMGLGERSAVIDSHGQINYSYGTSFSSPNMCGMAACLWQAFPELTNKEIIQVIREAGNRYDTPDPDYGYGIPDMGKAMEIAKQKLAIKKLKEKKK